MSDIQQINIPDLGDVEEVEVIEVCVEVGQKVESEDSIMILETDKAAMEIPASADGVVKNILIQVGDMVKEGMPFVELEIENDSEVKESKKEEVTKIANDDKKPTKHIEQETSSEIAIIKPAIPDLGDV